MTLKIRSFAICCVALGVLTGCAVRTVQPTPPVQAPPPLANPAPLEPTGESLLGIPWEASVLDGVSPLVAPLPTLQWSGHQQVIGNGGCNAFSGKAVIQQDTLQIGPLAPLGKPCITAPSGQEDLFFKALESTRHFRLDAGMLVLLDDKGKQLVRMKRTGAKP